MRLSQTLERAALCGDSLWSGWSSEQTAQALNSVNALAQRLHAHQLTECVRAEEHRCPPAEAPENGGLVCATIGDARYCKPLCHHGYDFAFLRLSRVFDECSEKTSYRWNSQYVGGNKLAVCNKSPSAAAGVRSAYFPEEQSCLQTKANSSLHISVVEHFLSELQGQGLQGQSKNTCLVCGLTL